jgi:hypothetical protein
MDKTPACATPTDPIFRRVTDHFLGTGSIFLNQGAKNLRSQQNYGVGVGQIKSQPLLFNNYRHPPSSSNLFHLVALGPLWDYFQTLSLFERLVLHHAPASHFPMTRACRISPQRPRICTPVLPSFLRMSTHLSRHSHLPCPRSRGV